MMSSALRLVQSISGDCCQVDVFARCRTSRSLMLFFIICLFVSFPSHFFVGMHHFLAAAHRPAASARAEGAERGPPASLSVLWRGMPLNLAVFSRGSPFCAQAEEVHCAADTPRKEASREPLSAGAPALKRPE